MIDCNAALTAAAPKRSLNMQAEYAAPVSDKVRRRLACALTMGGGNPPNLTLDDNVGFGDAFGGQCSVAMISTREISS